jgi:hypothetical protein
MNIQRASSSFSYMHTWIHDARVLCFYACIDEYTTCEFFVFIHAHMNTRRTGTLFLCMHRWIYNVQVLCLHTWIDYNKWRVSTVVSSTQRWIHDALVLVTSCSCMHRWIHKARAFCFHTCIHTCAWMLVMATLSFHACTQQLMMSAPWFSCLRTLTHAYQSL